jgi:hypothetical protein
MFHKVVSSALEILVKCKNYKHLNTQKNIKIIIIKVSNKYQKIHYNFFIIHYNVSTSNNKS